MNETKITLGAGSFRFSPGYDSKASLIATPRIASKRQERCFLAELREAIRKQRLLSGTY